MKKIKELGLILFATTTLFAGCKKNDQISSIPSELDAITLAKNSSTNEIAVSGKVESLLSVNNITANNNSLTRLYNPYSGVHMIAYPDETATLLAQRIKRGWNWFNAWTSDGIIGYGLRSQGGGTVPLYRYYADNDHYFSTSSNVPAGYVSEGVQTYVYAQPNLSTRPIYLFSTVDGQTDHVYSINPNELSGDSHWRSEGIAFYLLR